MKKIKATLIALAVLVSTVTIAPALPTYASDASNAISSGAGAATPSGTPSGVSLNSMIARVVDTLLFILGAVAVIMIIIGAFRYVTSGGDSGAITAAKNTILYAVIGLVVAILAYAIVNFVVSSFK